MTQTIGREKQFVGGASEESIWLDGAGFLPCQRVVHFM